MEGRGAFRGQFGGGDLEGEVQALTDLILAKNRYAIRRTKFVLNNVAESHLAQATAFEVPVDTGAGSGENQQGIRNFADKTNDWLLWVRRDLVCGGRLQLRRSATRAGRPNRTVRHVRRMPKLG